MADGRNDAAGYLGWFFLGGIVGAAAALLLAPKTGRETRELLSSNDWARKAQTMATEAQGRAGEWLDKSRELFEEQTQRLMTPFEAGKGPVRGEKKKGAPPPRGGGRAPQTPGEAGAGAQNAHPRRGAAA